MANLRSTAVASGFGILVLVVFVSREGFPIVRDLFNEITGIRNLGFTPKTGFYELLVLPSLAAAILGVGALALAIGGLRRRTAGSPVGVRGLRPWLITLGAAVTVVGIPSAITVLLNEHRSPYWYAIFVPFLPVGLFAGAQLALAGMWMLSRPRDTPATYLAGIAFLGAVLASLMILAFWSSSHFASLSELGLASACTAIACDFGIVWRGTVLRHRQPPGP